MTSLIDLRAIKRASLENTIIFFFLEEKRADFVDFKRLCPFLDVIYEFGAKFSHLNLLSRYNALMCDI